MTERLRPQPEAAPQAPRPLEMTPLEKVQIAREARENIRRTRNEDVIPATVRQDFNAAVAKILIEHEALPPSFHWAQRMDSGETLHAEFGGHATEIFNLHERKPTA